MGKKYKVLCLNGPYKGQEIEVEADYTVQQEEELKKKQAFVYEGVEYAGHCRQCRLAVRKEDANYQFNTNGYGTLTLNIHHRRCL